MLQYAGKSMNTASKYIYPSAKKKPASVQCEECYECFEDEEKLTWHNLNDHQLQCRLLISSEVFSLATQRSYVGENDPVPDIDLKFFCY